MGGRLRSVSTQKGIQKGNSDKGCSRERGKHMLLDKLKECEGSGGLMEARTGVCRFCGQQAIEDMPLEWTTEEADEYAAETCDCASASFYQRKKRQKERAHNRIAFLFGEGNQVEVVSEEVEGLLHEVVELVGDGEAKGATVEIGNGVKAKINATNNGKIKITRTKAERSAYEE